MKNLSAVHRAIQKGVEYLESAQLPSGEIPIEISPTHEMTEPCVRDPAVFCTALGARALLMVPAAALVRSRALDFLLREMHPGGLWRHPSSDKPGFQYTQLDVDDTALASAALTAAGRQFPNNRGLLGNQRLRNGLFRTWIVRWWPHPIMTYHFFKYIGKPRDVDSVINANAVYYLGDSPKTRSAIQHMLSVLRSNGEMTSTIWYGSRFTVWYFFSHALLQVAPEAGKLILSKLEAEAPGNALEQAAAASAFLLWNRVPDVGPLVENQLPSGAWPSVGFYHMGKRRPDFSPTPPWYGSQALTTVLAVEALSLYLNRVG
jgi:hypothetical protein